MTITEPFEILPSRIALRHFSSESKTFAVPLKYVPSLPDIFATAPLGAIFPLKIIKCPSFLIGLLKGLTILGVWIWFNTREITL